jgi:hypothetical protein
MFFIVIVLVHLAFFPGFNLVFPETLEDRSSVKKLLNHAQYDGGGFRLCRTSLSIHVVFFASQ